mgnify:CR=1 FL=1|jgi:hypothetical protein
MAKKDDGLLMILDFIETNWVAIFIVFLSFISFMIYNVINDVEYEKPNYKIQKIAIIEKLANMF